MLVLTRRIGERLRMGDIVLQILDIKGRFVRLGVEAPAEVTILREEVAQRFPGAGGGLQAKERRDKPSV